ncbi:MAG: hypothetical protein K8R36_08835, partial [Planctomycetales bacterium]|nr:hypothetical protein [Planctomycetales bacterium]
MSHLLKALRSLETRGAALAPPPAEPPVPDELCEAGMSLEEANSEPLRGASPVATPTAVGSTRLKPRPAARVKPRRATTEQAPVDLFAGRPLMETLSQGTRLPVAKKPEEAPAETAAAQTSQYTLAPAVIVNQAALSEGAALARALSAPAIATGQCSDELFSELSGTSKKQGTPARTPTLFEHRIHESLLHPARSRPFAELVQRLRRDFRGNQERSLLFTGIGQASRADEMLAHVAALFAEQGEKVLLVDADFERAGLTAGFGAGTLGGLQNAIVAPRNWQDHLLTTSFPNLAFLPSGRGNVPVAGAADTLA